MASQPDLEHFEANGLMKVEEGVEKGVKEEVEEQAEEEIEGMVGEEDEALARE